MVRLVIIFLFSSILTSCKARRILGLIKAEKSGIHFNNTIIDNDSLNVLDVENIYNGGGVGIGDFNNDGLQDIYFTANVVANKLYLNKGGFKFTDVTATARVSGDERSCRGVSVVDINNDGLLDLYVCASLSKESRKRENILYVNNGLNANGIPVFKNMAPEYGLNDTAHSTMAAFFDYDNDGDLDMYLLINEIIKNEYPNIFRAALKNREHPNTDKLFRNDWNDSLGHGVFTDVSSKAGITIEGYGHGVNVADINKDGWKDIYVTNDFLSANLLYINQHDGTFKNDINIYFKHTSENSMGQDIIDINNDGLVDVIELDMNPEDNFRKKMMMNPLSYQRYQNNDYYGYQYQYVRNVLQINQGPRMLQNDTVGAPIFSDIAFFAGIAETDWSWTPSVADFDNDGLRDIIITNGFPKDVTDHDFMTFRNKANSLAAKKDILEQIPQVKISNYAYKNKGDLTFENVTQEWGIEKPGFSNGAAYADLDNDGDLDIVINNINDEASLYKNNSKEIHAGESKFLKVKFKGDELNMDGIGAWIEIYYNQLNTQVYENTPYRGYLSSIQNIAHFGLGKSTIIDSIVVKWPNGKMQILKNQKTDQTIVADIKNAAIDYSFNGKAISSNSLFKEITSLTKVNYIHEDRDFVDFNIQKLLPHKFSEYGPGLAVGDIDRNGVDDIVCGGSFFFGAQTFLQQPGGGFMQKSLSLFPDTLNKKTEDTGLLLFDADGDNDLDLYIAGGGYEAESNSSSYQDVFYTNDGKGNFSRNNTAIPINFVSKFCVRAADYDKDGDFDLFIAGRVDPGKYPRPVSSFIYRNDTKNGAIKFTDVSNEVAPELKNIGLICDALFTDFDNDGWQDIIMAGEWMPVTFFKNGQGIFKNVTTLSGISKEYGWWNTIAPGDFDNDGDMDYIVGNLGQNSFYKASHQYPVYITASDFDGNGSYDAIPSLFLPQSYTHPEKKEFPAHLRDDLIKQMIGLRAKFQNYNTYASATMQQLLTREQLKEALRLSANNLQSSYLQNKGGGKFIISTLPIKAQISVLNGMVAEDFDDDGNLDVIINGNDYGTEVSVGRYDALNGLFLKGNGKGNFSALSIIESGVFLPGNGKALVKLKSNTGKCLIAASENKGPLRIFELKKEMRNIPFKGSDVSATIRYADGKFRKCENYYGSSFLSQSGPFLTIGGNVSAIDILDSEGKHRTINLQ